MHDDHPAPELIEALLPFTRYAQRLVESEPALLTELRQGVQRPFRREEMRAFLNADPSAGNDEAELYKVLRGLRKRVMLRLAMRDLGGWANLDEVMVTMTEMAELTIGFALKHQQSWLTDPTRFGQPRSVKGELQEMLVVAMGKLGGSELNVSSDVDLIFVYPEDGETDGNRPISNHDFFARLGRKLIASLNNVTPDGYVFRTDMRLRPYGESGPLAMSFAMLEQYFITQGREWERYAWIKSRVIAGSEVESRVLMERITQPFVFRKYLDFGAHESLRGLHAQIRQEVNRREMHGDIKLGPGGIREIEFIAQLFQLIRGGRDIDLRIRSTLAVFKRLQEKKLLTDKVVAELSGAYYFLRKLEHRLQYMDDQQTQTLPEITADQLLIASSMGFSSYDEFLQQLDSHRMHVTCHFEKIFAVPQKPQASSQLAGLWQDKDSRSARDNQDNRDGDRAEAVAATEQLVTMGFTSPEKILGRLQEFRAGTRYRQLPEPSKDRVDALVPALIEVAARFPPADLTLERLLQLLESISRRAAYLALLREYPKALERVAKLVCASQWAGDYLSRHPILLDELLNPVDFQGAPDWSRSRAGLIQQLGETGGRGGHDVEEQMDVLRHFHHAQVFQLLARDVEGLLPLEILSDHLTALADLILDTVLRFAWSGLRKKHRDEPAFGIIGYGKLGGKELGYASDLDIIFLYDDSHADAGEIYARLSQRINAWLTSYTSAGLLYETDLRLRPNGSSGLLVSSIQAFDQYQRNQAWVWEHQALTRARFVAGDIRVGQAFELIRREVLCQRREPALLKREVLAMRQKIHDAHPNTSALFDIKHDRGGIIDVEFIVQYLVLGHAFEYLDLTNNIGNIALLKLAGKLGLIDVDSAERVLSAYREFRRLQHRLRLSGDSGLTGIPSTDSKSQKFARFETDDVKNGVAAVLRLWDEVFDSSRL